MSSERIDRTHFNIGGSLSGLKLLLVGPYPPPHGGISVHVQNASTLVRRNGADSKILNVDPRAPKNDGYIRINSAADLGFALLRHAWDDWTIHVHINGHNPKSWAIALAAGFAAQTGNGGLLTIHSGLAPEYLKKCPLAQRRLARLACLQFDRIVCVNEEIAAVLEVLGIPPHRLDIIPAFLPLTTSPVAISVDLENWIKARYPVLSTAMFFRPEYGFELLVSGLKKLVAHYPRLGCLIMGSGEEQETAAMFIRRERLTDSVQLLGDVDHEVCMALMKRSTVFVRPTLKDGDSICVREAVSLGIPVVASDVGTRPPEAMLFKAGHVDEFVFQVDRALKAAGEQAPVIHVDTVNRLLNLYSVASR